ncbi:TIGR02677 family protein [Brevibacillus parabrevis]|uniref:TIGR02677 family protein n=1 Tax=Brevibacillus parabrevis TaxID=54914 RepID=UPI001F604421|nr:TIGR02677 family protein [Brevibacillus parabrevis]MDR5000448.1 TIGR02677 family protein [Brevibacillus parabrevis]
MSFQLNSVKEATYLSVPKADRYRPICYVFYQKYRQEYNSYMFLDDVYRELVTSEQFGAHFKDYSEKELEEDLKALVKWNNLIVHQDESHAQRIEDFYKRKNYYEVTQYTISLERTMEEMQYNLQAIRGGSFERVLADHILEDLTKLRRWRPSNNGTLGDIRNIWRDLMSRFEALRNGTADFLSHVNSEPYERLIRTESFLPYKEKFVRLLSDFVVGIMEKKDLIEERLGFIDDSEIEQIIAAIVSYEAEQQIDDKFEAELASERRRAEWFGFKGWFVEINGRKANSRFLIEQTRGTIQKIVRIADQISDKFNYFKSRKNDYLELARIFANTSDLRDCHVIAGAMFGVSTAKHFLVSRKSEDDNSKHVWECDPFEMPLSKKTPGNRNGRTKLPVYEDPLVQMSLIQEHLEKTRMVQEQFNSLIKDGKITLEEIGVVYPEVRDLLLELLGQAMITKSLTSRTEDGRQVSLILRSRKRIRLRSTDGTLTMNDYEFVFMEEQNG